MLRSFARLSSAGEAIAPKVPEITALFWAIKVLTTGMGESMSDALGQQSVPLAGAVGVVGLVLAIRLQLREREYRAPVYWLAVMAVAIFGTMAADAVHVAGLPYAITTPLYGALVAVIFYRWHRSEGTLSIHSITTPRRESYYWAAVLATFALGTAAGDLTAISLSLGYLGSVVLFGVVIMLPALAWWSGKLNPIVAFWASYVVTRPLGASFADWFGKPSDQTGLGLGDGLVSGLALIAFIALVAYVSVTKGDVQQPSSAHVEPHVASAAAAQVVLGPPQPAER